jgi:hypothetical protein
MPSVAEHKPLLMRANRVLGAALVELNLVKIQDIEEANEKLLELVSKAQWRQSSVLAILAYDTKVLREDDLLQHVVEMDGVGLVDLRDYEVPDESRKHLDMGACWATWSVPFDREEEFYFVATAYYLSSAVRAFWEKQLGGPILWFGTTLDNVADYLEKLQTERTASLTPFGSRAPVAGAAAVPGGTPRIFPAPAKT